VTVETLYEAVASSRDIPHRGMDCGNRTWLDDCERHGVESKCAAPREDERVRELAATLQRFSGGDGVAEQDQDVAQMTMQYTQFPEGEEPEGV
jgi:hypothetical protein